MSVIWFDVYAMKPHVFEVPHGSLFALQNASLVSMTSKDLRDVQWSLTLVCTDLHCVVVREDGANFARGQTILIPAGKYEMSLTIARAPLDADIIFARACVKREKKSRKIEF